MYWFITITRGNLKFYVVSPSYGKYDLSLTMDRNTYLWVSEDSARNDQRWQHLIEKNDTVAYHRTYRC